MWKTQSPEIVSKFVERPAEYHGKVIQKFAYLSELKNLRPAEYHGKVIQKFVYLSELKKFLLVERLAPLNYFMIIGLHWPLDPGGGGLDR